MVCSSNLFLVTSEQSFTIIYEYEPMYYAYSIRVSLWWLLWCIKSRKRWISRTLNAERNQFRLKKKIVNKSFPFNWNFYVLALDCQILNLMRAQQNVGVVVKVFYHDVIQIYYGGSWPVMANKFHGFIHHLWPGHPQMFIVIGLDLRWTSRVLRYVEKKINMDRCCQWTFPESIWFFFSRPATHPNIHICTLWRIKGIVWK